MELKNTFVVPGKPDDVFQMLLDLEEVALCMPGATLTGHQGDEYQGTLKLKVGPIAAAYQGTLVVADVDRSARSARLEATAKEMTGQGSADATIYAMVEDDPDGSRVSVTTDVNIRGKAAQFGRGVLADVTQRVVDQFAHNLEARLLAGESVASDTSTAETGVPVTDSLDLLSVVALPALKRAAPALGGLFVGLLLGWLLGRRGAGATRISDEAT